MSFKLKSQIIIREAAVYFYAASCRSIALRHALYIAEQAALAGARRSDYAQHFAAVDCKLYIFRRSALIASAGYSYAVEMSYNVLRG